MTLLQNRATGDELTMVRDYILLPYMMTIVERSRQEIEHSSNPLRDLMSRFMIALLDAINADLVKIRIAMSKSNIKVWDDGQQDEIIYHKYRCRGYEERFGMIREVMRSEIRVKLTKYGSQLLKSTAE